MRSFPQVAHNRRVQRTMLVQRGLEAVDVGDGVRGSRLQLQLPPVSRRCIRPRFCWSRAERSGAQEGELLVGGVEEGGDLALLSEVAGDADGLVRQEDCGILKMSFPTWTPVLATRARRIMRGVPLSQAKKGVWTARRARC